MPAFVFGFSPVAVPVNGAAIGGETFTYYVDSEAVPPGLGTRAQPWVSLLSLPTLAAADSVGLAFGGHWREVLSLDTDGIGFGAFGDEAKPKPLVDGSDPFVAADWQSAGGGVYFVTVTGPGGANVFLRVWDDDSTAVFTLASGDTGLAPGQYFVDDMTILTPTFYFRDFDSSDPRSNGKTYSHTVRQYAVRLGGDDVTVSTVATRRAAANDGSLICAGKAKWENVSALGGNKHNGLFDHGEIDGIDAIDGYFGGTTADLLEAHMNTATTDRTLIIRNANLRLDTYDATVAAFDFHVTGGGSYASIETFDVHVENTGGGLSGSDAAQVTHTRPTTLNTQFAHGVICNTTLIDLLDISSQAGGHLIQVEAADITVIVDGQNTRMCRSNYASFPILSTSTGCTLRLLAGQYGAATFTDFGLVQWDYGTCVITGIRFDPDHGAFVGIIGRPDQSVDFTLNFNTYASSGVNLEVNSPDFQQYIGLAQIQGAGYDLNSVVGAVDACI